MTYDWLGRWQRNDVTFHLSQVNPLLIQYWSHLNIPAPATVLVPLCGKSLDMLWLADQGYRVIGVELSPIACEAFFIEHDLPYTVTPQGDFIFYHSEAIDIYCGDFFKLTQAMLPEIAAVYDRAALVALPDDLRQQYAKQIQTLSSAQAQILLLVNEAKNPSIIQGPPYSLARTDLQNLYGNHFSITELARLKRETVPPHWHQKGYRDGETFEVVYLLKRI